MALMKSKEVPKDGVVLSEFEAVNYAWDVVTNWDNLAETWALRYGPTILGGINALSGIFINSHYRTKLKLGSYGFFSSVIPLSIMPGMLTPLFHRHLVSTQVLLLNNEGCPICYEFRSTAIQLSIGLLYPMMLAPIASLMLANRYSTARVPELKQTKMLFKYVQKITRPLSGSLALLAGFQVVSSAVITYFELKNNIAIRKKIMEIESKIESNENN